MDFFDLPKRTRVERVIPKSAFDHYTNTKQKKLFTDCIQRISWTHKLSADTVNLDAKDVQEIQVFKVELKQKTDILKILEIINKSISYHIVFWVEHNQEAYISTASKHPHPTNEDVSVIDWTFTSEWFNKENNIYALNLKGSLDAVFKDICLQLTGRPDWGRKHLNDIVSNEQELNRLISERKRLKAAISRCTQFNQKVEMNVKLKKVEAELEILNRGV